VTRAARRATLAPMARRLRLWMFAAATTLSSLASLAAAVLLANFAPGALPLLCLLVIPLTVGLPTTLAALVLTSLWSGPPVWLFGGACALLGVALQAAVFALLARWRQHRRR
jgi:hypothetical protein